MNLSEIKAQFLALANRRDLTANPALTQTFIDQGVMRVQRELRVPAMEKSYLITIGAGYAGLVLPPDFLEMIRLVPAQSQQELVKCDLPRALNLARYTGCPEEYARQGALLILGPAPVSGDVIRLDYYAEIPPLVNPTDTSVMTLIAWDLIMYAALTQAAIYYKDDRKDVFDGQYEAIKQTLQDQADQDELNGAEQVMPTYTFPLDYQFENY